jgi:hypothetical protein
VHELLLALLHRRVIKKAHRGGIDDDAFAGRVRQDELRRDHDLLALARQPRIHIRVRTHDFLVPHIEAARDVGERVFLAGLGFLHHADDVGGGFDFESMGRDGLRHRGNHRLLHDFLLAPLGTGVEQRATGNGNNQRRCQQHLGGG